MNEPSQILVIEDNQADQYVARRRLLKRWPRVQIVVVADGIDAIAHLDSGVPLPDLILLDINMPRMGGHDFLRHWYGERSLRIPVVVMLTSSTQEDDRERSSRFENVRGFITKPLDVDDIDQLARYIPGPDPG